MGCMIRSTKPQQESISFLKLPEALWSRASLLFNGYWKPFVQVEKFTTNLHLVPNLRKRGAMHPHPIFFIITSIRTISSSLALQPLVCFGLLDDLTPWISISYLNPPCLHFQDLKTF
jgi:hypothetical protein